MRRLRRGDDTGAIAILVALLMVVMLGVATIVVDVGMLYAERRQLQNGADSAALSVALDCARTTCAGSSSALTTATNAAKANANDGTATVTQVCGTAPGLSACTPAPQVGAWDCPPQPSGSLGSAPYVLVRTQTNSKGSNVMPPVFAKVLVPGYTGTTVKACARAGYGAPSTATTLAITESLCEWQAGTSNGATYAPAPPYPPNPSTSLERVIYFHTATLAGHCPAGPSGADLPGGFGWLDDPNGNCTTTVSTSGTYGADPGASISKPCKDALAAARSGRYVVYLPVYNSLSGTGQNGVYTLKGFAAFVVTGYRMPSLTASSWLTGAAPCKAPNTCISGFFTQGLIPGGGTIGGGPSLGANVVQLTG